MALYFKEYKCNVCGSTRKIHKSENMTPEQFEKSLPSYLTCVWNGCVAACFPINPREG